MSDPEHEREAAWRWGNTEAHHESTRRTCGYGPKEWALLKEEQARLTAALADAKRRGVAPDSDEAADLAELSREHTCRWFYPLDHAMHALLAEGYVSDPRFRAYYEREEEGLAAWFSAAVVANAARAGADLTREDALADLKASMGLLGPKASEPVGKSEERPRQARRAERRARRHS